MSEISKIYYKVFAFTGKEGRLLRFLRLAHMWFLVIIMLPFMLAAQAIVNVTIDLKDSVVLNFKESIDDYKHFFKQATKQ